MEQINYVVGYPWKDRDPNQLCIYTYFHQIQHGTLEDATEFLDYCKKKEPTKPYKIYQVTFTEVSKL